MSPRPPAITMQLYADALDEHRAATRATDVMWPEKIDVELARVVRTV